MRTITTAGSSEVDAARRVARFGLTFLAAATTLVMLTCSCASTSVKSAWKSPEYKGTPPQKVAVVTDDERMLVREALENRFVNQLTAASQPAFATVKALPDLVAARQNKEATVKQLRGDGADAILITRLVSRSAYMARAKEQFTGQYVALTVTPSSQGWDTSIGSFSAYSSGPRSDDRSYLLLDTSLFDLATGQRIWACLTETTLKESDDKLDVADEFVATVVKSMRQDGMIR